MPVPKNAEKTIEIVQNARDGITATLLDQGEEAVDLSGRQIVTRWIRSVLKTNKVNDAPCVVDPDQAANKGKVTFTPGATDTDELGLFYVYFLDVTAPATPIRYPFDGPLFRIHVVPEA